MASTAERNHHVLAAAALLLTAACGTPKLLSAPEGIAIFEDREYRGRSVTIDRDIRDLDEFQGPCYETEGSYPTQSTSYTWNDCISSIRVPAGWSATVYGDDDYEGSSLTITADVPDLRRVPGRCGEGMNDCISSIRVSRD
jgi:hypothetical protein